jgi:hypothetical protein
MNSTREWDWMDTLKKNEHMNDKELLIQAIHEAWKQGLVMRSIDVEPNGEHLWLSNKVGATNPNFLTYQEWKDK